MASINLVEIVKHAKEVGLSPSDINVLLSKEEERFVQQIEREERQREKDVKKMEFEVNKAEMKREHELALAKLQTEKQEMPHESMTSYPGLKLPNFNDGKDEIDDYLKRFERMAELQNWERQNYHVYLGSLLGGKALRVYVNFPAQVLHDYGQLKEALLEAYSIDADSYRKKFRKSKVGENETYVQLVSRMRQNLDSWLTLN